MIFAGVHTPPTACDILILWAGRRSPASSLLSLPSFRILVPPRKRRNPNWSEWAIEDSAAYSGIVAWGRASAEPLDAYCRWNMFDEGEKELTIFIAGCARATNGGRERVGCSRKGMSGVSRNRQRWTKEKERERKRERERGWERRATEKVRGEGCISCCTSRHSKFARRLQRQAFHRLWWCSKLHRKTVATPSEEP